MIMRVLYRPNRQSGGGGYFPLSFSNEKPGRCPHWRGVLPPSSSDRPQHPHLRDRNSVARIGLDTEAGLLLYVVVRKNAPTAPLGKA